MIISKTALYAGISAIPVLINSNIPPATWWDWVRLMASVLLAGMTAIKALQSDPPLPTPIPPAPVIPIPEPQILPVISRPP